MGGYLETEGNSLSPGSGQLACKGTFRGNVTPSSKSDFFASVSSGLDSQSLAVKYDSRVKEYSLMYYTRFFLKKYNPSMGHGVQNSRNEENREPMLVLGLMAY